MGGFMEQLLDTPNWVQPFYWFIFYCVFLTVNIRGAGASLGMRRGMFNHYFDGFVAIQPLYFPFNTVCNRQYPLYMMVDGGELLSSLNQAFHSSWLLSPFQSLQSCGSDPATWWRVWGEGVFDRLLTCGVVDAHPVLLYPPPDDGWDTTKGHLTSIPEDDDKWGHSEWMPFVGGGGDTVSWPWKHCITLNACYPPPPGIRGYYCRHPLCCLVLPCCWRAADCSRRLSRRHAQRSKGYCRFLGHSHWYEFVQKECLMLCVVLTSQFAPFWRPSQILVLLQELLGLEWGAWTFMNGWIKNKTQKGFVRYLKICELTK